MPLKISSALALLLCPVVVMADGPGAPADRAEVLVPVAPDGPAMNNVLRFTAGVGVQSQPGYFGSDEVVVGPTGSFSFEYLRYGAFELGEPNPNAVPLGLSFGGSVRFVSERSAEDYPELIGLEDLDLSVEVGAGLTYTQPNYEVFADVRYGVIGHEALVGEVGMDLFVRPSDRLTLSAGPRVFWAADDYVDTYFGVDPEASSSFEAYDPDGGLVSAGVEIGAEYELNDIWGIEGTVRYDRYLGDAADSPVVTGGSDDSVTATILATRRFTFEF